MISGARYRAFSVAFCVWLLFVSATASAAGEWVTVRRVADGDTVQLTDHRLVRYIGVNAPEIDHELHTAEPFGFEARSLNTELMGAKRIRLEFDLERLDAYGRTLAYVFLPDGTMVNAKLLQSGLSYYFCKTPNVKHADLLLRAQREAMQARRGIWRGWQEGQGRYVGNRNSKRFHLTGCQEVKRIAPQNRVVYSKRWDAFWAGYSPSKECQPTLKLPVE